MMFNPEKRNPSAALSETLTDLIDAAIVKKRDEEYAAGRGAGGGEVAKKRIGSGYIGVECDRALAYRYHRVAAEERPPDAAGVSRGALQRHADSGYWTEGKIAEWLKLVGFDLHTHKESGKQFGYKACPDPATGQARMAGEIDGVILGGPIELPYPVLWESKKATAKKFAKFVKGGVKGADAKYYGQLQHNHVMMDVGNTLFSMLCLDSMEFYFELVAFDAPVAQRLNDRAARVIESQSPDEFGRITTDPSDFRCKFCDYKGACWSVRETAPLPSLPAWAMAQ